MFLMPSRFEPCGLGQMIAMRYGTIPIVRRTGGLADTVMDDPLAHAGTGFVFDVYDPEACFAAVARALETYHDPAAWDVLVSHAMARDFSWAVSAHEYAALYHRAVIARYNPGVDR